MPSITRSSNTTAIRRKPQYTYKSPSAQDREPVLPNLPRNIISHSIQDRTANAAGNDTLPNGFLKKPVKRNSCGLHALPLYHPMGTLALSLPPIDPASFGLPSPNALDDHHNANGSFTHIISPGNHPDENAAIGAVPVVSVGEAMEKATPRKRRFAGGSKRKRKDMDDGDSTYPTRRTRPPRSVIHQADSEEPADEAAAIDTEQNEIVDAKKPERRSTRSRGNPNQCDSSFSDGGSGILPPGAVETSTTPIIVATDLQRRHQKLSMTLQSTRRKTVN